MESFRKEKNKKRKYTPIMNIVRNAAKKGAIAMSLLGALTMATPEKKTSPEKKPKRIELNMSKPVVAPPVINENELKKGTTGKNTLISIDNRKFELLGKPKNFLEENFLKFAFKEIDQKRINEIQLEAGKRGVIDPETRFSDPEDMFYLIWNVYREGKTGIRYSPNLMNDIKSNRLQDEKLNLEMKRKGANVQEISKKILEGKNTLNNLLSKKTAEEALGKKELRAERLAFILTVLDRCESPKFPKEIKTNILKEKAFSWTFEEKYPMMEEKPGNVPETEMISYEALLEINSLVSEFVSGRKFSDSKKLIRAEIAFQLGKSEVDIPEMTFYNTVDFMPDDSGKFSKVAKKATSTNTKNRLRDTKALIDSGFIPSIKIGSHIFYAHD